MFCEGIKPFREECPSCVEIEKKYRLNGDDRLNYQISKRTAYYLKAIVSSYIYSGDAADLVVRYKFRQHYTLARDMAKIMASDIIELLGKDCCDAVMPVPAYRKGVNQHSALIARRISKVLSTPYLSKTLVKIRETAPQHELSGTQRSKNLGGAFYITGRGTVKNKRILLCDDVITSGNTLNECANVLLGAGAYEVLSAVFSATP